MERFINGNKNSCLGFKNIPCDLTMVKLMLDSGQ